MTYILATIMRGHEFAAAEAINEMDAIAVVPRAVQIIPAKDGKPEIIQYRPLLPRMLFVACTELQWHHIRTRRLMGPRGILPPLHRALDILPRAWDATDGVTGFLARAERACDLRLEQWEAGRKVTRYKRGDMIRIIGDMMDGRLRDKLARVLKADGNTVEAQVIGMDMLGKPLRVGLGRGDAVAAE